MEWYIESCPYFRIRSGRPPPNRARRPFVGSLIDCEDDCDDQPVQSHHHDTRSRDQYQDKWDELAELRTVTDSNTDKLRELRTVTDSHDRRIDDLVRYLRTCQVIFEVNFRSYSFYILYCIDGMVHGFVRCLTFLHRRLTSISLRYKLLTLINLTHRGGRTRCRLCRMRCLGRRASQRLRTWKM